MRGLSNHFGEGVGISRNWATAHFLVFCGWSNCHSTSGCVVQHVDMLQGVYNEAQGLLEVKPSTILGLVDSNRFMLYPQ